MAETAFQPGYIALYRSGELQRRARALEARLARCDICPRECGVDRLRGLEGWCRSGYLPLISAVCDHHGEEPPISGTKGSGAIFFGNCTLKCLYCQNHQISQDPQRQRAKEADCLALARHMLHLQEELGCHNINLVSPSHFVPQIVRALVEAVPLGLRIPLVYNTNGYDSLATLRELDGIVDIYLPDLKYASDTWAMKFSQAREYVRHARAAIAEMHRQVGNLVIGEDGVAQRGLIVRHLILPNGIAGSEESLPWLATALSPEVTVSIMSQYHPCHRAPRVPLLSRHIAPAEHAEVLDLLDRLGLESGWVQELDSAETYLPDFDREAHPFIPTQ